MPKVKPGDRRLNFRYSMRNPMRFRKVGPASVSGWRQGRTLNISASGMLLEVPGRIEVGNSLELAIEWTGLYHGCEKMQLCVIGAVTRVDEQGTALRIISHRFRELRQPIAAAARIPSLAARHAYQPATQHIA